MADYPDFYDSFESSGSDSEDGVGHDTVIKGDEEHHLPTHLYLHNLGKHEESYDLSSQSKVTPYNISSGSPKSSPLNKRKFRPHFKKPTGLGNITQKIKKRKKKEIFGVSLQIAISHSVLGKDGIELPTVFRQCIDYLEENALSNEGLYRLAGVKSQIDGIKALYDKDQDVDLSSYDANTVASLLKLFLRELPEPLVYQRLLPKLETASKIESAEMQLSIIKPLIDELPYCNRLMLGWLFEHISHVVEKSGVNKMGIVNVVIVFSPTLQIPISLMHLLFNHRNEIFPDTKIKKYQRRQQSTTNFDLPDPNTLETQEEIDSELLRLGEMLEKLHTEVRSSDGRYDERDDYCWELQRIITELKRKKKMYDQLSVSKQEDEQDFMKAFILMAATLEAENDELKDKNFILKEAIRNEVKKIDTYKRTLELYESRASAGKDDREEEEEMFLADESEFSQTMSKLLWKKRDLQSEYNELWENIRKEEKKVTKYRVQLRVAPLDN